MILGEELFEDIESKEIPNIKDADISADTLELDGPKAGVDTGIANLIHDLIINAHEAVQNYNNAVANLDSHPEIIPIIEELATSEMRSIGMLEVALKLLSPNAENINAGEEEASIDISDNDEIDEGIFSKKQKSNISVDNGKSDIEDIKNQAKKFKDLNDKLKSINLKDIKEDTEKKSNGNWVNKGADGEHGEFKTKKDADSQRKAMFANGYHENFKE